MNVLRMAREEWRILRANPGVWLSLLLFTLLAGYGLYNGARHTRRLEESARLAAAYNAAQVEKTRAAFSRLNARPGATGAASVPWHAGIVAYELMPQAALVPTPLAPVAVGQSDLYPTMLLMRTRLDAVKGSDEIENPLHLLTGSFDLAFVLVYALPLLILGLGYNVLSGEKEEGTLALALAQGASVQSLTLGKLLLRFALVLGVAWAVPTAGLLIAGRDLAAPSALIRLLLLYGVIAVYTLFWFGAVFVAGAITRRSATSAVLLLGLWLALVLVVPSLAGTLVSVVHPTPSRLELAQAVRTATDAAEAKGERLLQSLYQEHPEYAPSATARDTEDFWVRRYAAEAEVEQTVTPLLARFETQWRAQHRLGARLAVFSPALLTQIALTEVAGTSETRYVRFHDQVSGFRDEWRRFFLPRIFRRESVPESEWSGLPKLLPSDISTGSLAGRVASLLRVPVFVTLLLYGAGLRVLRRYPAAG
jgi:ABC-2 type transport system permease protein